MPLIRVDMFAGRSRAQKRALAHALSEAYVRVCGGPPQSVTLLLAEVEKEDWAVGGELLCAKLPDTP